MITSLLVRCSYVWLFAWLAVTTTAIPFLFALKGIPGAAAGCVYVLVTAGVAGFFGLVPHTIGRMAIGRRVQWNSAIQNILRDNSHLRSPFFRIADFMLAAVVVMVTAIPLYALYWTAGHHLAFLACSVGQYELGERISKTVRVSSNWNDETLVGLFDREGNREPLERGQYELEKTLGVNDAIANIYGFNSRQMALRFKQLGDSSLRYMRTAPEGSSEATEAIYYAENRYMQSMDIYRELGASGNYAEALAQLSYCSYLLGDRSASYNYFSEALSVVSRMDPTLQRKSYRSIYAIGRMMGISNRHYVGLGGPHRYRGRENPGVWLFGLLFLPSLVFFRLLIPTVAMSLHAASIRRRLAEQTSVAHALSDLDSLAVTQLCCEKLDAADETTKVMLKLAETEDVTVVRTMLRTPERQYSIA